MAKSRPAFVCQTCGARFPKWLGRCPDCGGWNSVIEEAPAAPASILAFSARAPATGKSRAESLADEDRPGKPFGKDRPAPQERISTGLAEVDRVLGGGFLDGTVALLGGDPGIGKSTLVLQALDRAGARGVPALYVSGEESAAQIRDRARRLGLSGRNVHLLAETDLEALGPEIARLSPRLVAIDSIQTVRSGGAAGMLAAPAAGTVSQVRECTAQFVQLAKSTGACVILIGHVTKDGALAGPRALEHMVDVVLSLEGEDSRPQRLLRCTKNRFGSIQEVGVFRMTGEGLSPVDNPSALFLLERAAGAPGTVVFPGMEGTRPLLVEIQALVGDGTTAYPRRTAVGVDPNRVALLQAVIEKHLGLSLAGMDVFVNVVGGLRLSEPALDAAAIAALVSSMRRRPIDPATVVFGEVGLTGELRGVGFAAERLAEAARLGFTRALMPPLKAAGAPVPLPKGMQAVPVATVVELADAL
jgi:DNA repair protein RadA/Sms